MARPRVNRPAQALAIAVFAGVAAFIGWWHYDRQWLLEPVAALEGPVIFEISRGTSLSAVARRLEQAGIIERPKSWVRHANREGVATRLKAGEYRLQPGTTPAMLLDQFVAGDVILHALTLP